MSGGTSSKMSSGYRYEANVIVFVALICALRICHSILSYPCLTTKFFGTLLIIFTTFFAFTWSRYHSSGLTRRRRAHFNELNVIETYQKSSRDPDYDFIADPPTLAPSFCPYPVDEEEEQHSHEDNSEKMSKEEFNKRRDSHYVDMYKTAAKAFEDSHVSTAKSSNRDFDEEMLDNDQVDFAEINAAIAKATEVNPIDTKLETEGDGQKKSP